MRCPRCDLDELISLGEIGHIRRILDKLSEIETRSPECGAFVARIRTIVNTFDLRRYAAALRGFVTPMRKRDRPIVLVVDDSPETLRLLTDAIEDAGMTVLVAREGEHALSIVERVLPDISLMDAVMPGTDGFETCRTPQAQQARSPMCRSSS